MIFLVIARKILRDWKFFHHKLDAASAGAVLVRTKGDNVAGALCSCGFAEVAGVDETVGDHLFEVFAPEDGKGLDGLVHLEGEVSLFCMCEAGGSAAMLDAHFLAVFTPDNSIGRDGKRHEPVSAATPP
jgi:hypothetical protein